MMTQIDNAEFIRLKGIERKMSALLAESGNSHIDDHFVEYMLETMEMCLKGGPYERRTISLPLLIEI